ncbi:MAG: hypothetical protein KDC95_06270 [Planctomycetes bacterium]|nr:hypothetical protein [Planctomycetota bacterium]
MNPSKITILALTALLSCVGANAQGPLPGVTQDWSKVAQRIAWHGTWNGAIAAAKSTERPILLIAAAPHCGLVPGMW